MCWVWDSRRTWRCSGLAARAFPTHGTGFGTDDPGQVLAATGGSPLNARPVRRTEAPSNFT